MHRLFYLIIQRSQMKNSLLTTRILRYQKTGEGKEDLDRDIALLAYRYVQNNRSLTEDEAGDFFCDCYPKLMGLIDNFSYCGRPFEAYLYISLRWYILHYRKTVMKNRLSHSVFSLSSFWEVNQYEPDYSSGQSTGRSSEMLPLSRTARKRFIYLALRESEYLTHAMVEDIVELSHIDRRWFLNCVMALKDKLERRRARLTAAQHYHNRCFYQYHVLQLRVQQCADDQSRKDLTVQMINMKEKLRRSSEKIKRLHVHPTNREISEVLNIPKGTIDSGIYYLRNNFGSQKENDAA